LIPGSHVQVEAMNNSVVLTGSVGSASDADKAVQLARATVEKPDQVINMLAISGKDQVMLKVRIVEMQRNVIKQLGINWQSVLNQAGSPQFVFGQAAGYGINGALLGGATAALTDNKPGSHSYSVNLQAFERVGLVRTLAEPNLTAVSGEAAHFLVGGEFPVPVGEDNSGRVTVVFKQFGVGLGFTPVVLSGGRISLKLSTEVSQISNEGSFSLSSGSGSPALVIPSLIVRRAATSVELPSGGALMIAGLLQNTSRQDIDALPGIKEVPILGALFRSRDYLAGETELVIIITPYLVDAASPADLQTPADGLEIASDADTILMGRLNKTYGRAPAAPTGRTYQGPHGYVVE